MIVPTRRRSNTCFKYNSVQAEIFHYSVQWHLMTVDNQSIINQFLISSSNLSNNSEIYQTWVFFYITVAKYSPSNLNFFSSIICAYAFCVTKPFVNLLNVAQSCLTTVVGNRFQNNYHSRMSLCKVVYNKLPPDILLILIQWNQLLNIFFQKGTT